MISWTLNSSSTCLLNHFAVKSTSTPESVVDRRSVRTRSAPRSNAVAARRTCRLNSEEDRNDARFHLAANTKRSPTRCRQSTFTTIVFERARRFLARHRAILGGEATRRTKKSRLKPIDRSIGGRLKRLIHASSLEIISMRSDKNSRSLAANSFAPTHRRRDAFSFRREDHNRDLSFV